MVLKGTVESLGPASGVSYSAVAPPNATGNFTKIAERLPVRIRIDPRRPAAEKLHVGMSVTPKIYVDGGQQQRAQHQVVPAGEPLT